MSNPLRAGTHRIDFELSLGLPMMGYGAREGTSTGRADPLAARALFLEGSGRVLLVECDLCLMAVSQARDVRERIARSTGLAPEEILVGCTHTHSAPDTGLGEILAGRPGPPHVASLLDTAVAAGQGAFANARRARMGLALVPVEIGRNRRNAEGPMDSVARVLRVDDDAGGVLAVAHWHGCHPTALGHDNLSYSADWPGAAGKVIEARFPGANVIFGLGAHADVDPRTRGLLDLAIPDQSVGVDLPTMRALGREYGEAVARAAAEIEVVEDGRVGARCAQVVLAPHACGGSAADRAEALAGLRADALVALDQPADSQIRTSDFYRLESECTKGLRPDEVRNRISRVRRYLRDRTARRFAGGDEATVEVQVLRIGSMWLLGIPAECCVDVGLDWAERVGGEGSTVVSIANGWLRYLPHPRNFRERHALQRYEILQSTFGPDAAEHLLVAGAELVQSFEAVPTAAEGM